MVSNKNAASNNFARLPKTVVPQRYDLTLKPDLQSFTFTGNETIDVIVNEATNKVVLNALDLKINCASFRNTLGNVIQAEDCTVCDKSEVATITFPSNLDIGEGKLSLDFVGNLNDKLKGFYRSKYITPEGEERFSAATKFEPTNARRALPCWDEPAIKARFDVTLIVPKDRMALSNMNVISEEVEQDLKIVKFATSPIMSTYLLAFIVGEYDFVEGITDNGVKVRVYTPLAKKDQGLFALDAALKSLSFYENYFQIAYPLPKMDLIAIADFASGAMENWGLITFREVCLLFDSKNSSKIRKQYIALVVAHEIAHQWFGNLVTMEWWTHLWLNEGFASFIEYLCVANLFSEYDIWTQCVTDAYLPALHMDSLHNSHPIEVPVGHPSEIAEIFDAISYNKGASVIRMLHQFLGDKLFSQGLSLYLSKHSYKNTVTEDLWDAFEEVSKEPIRKVMDTWTKQTGYPVITVTERQNGNDRILVLNQEKFSADGKLDETDKDVLWLVPLSITTQSNLTVKTKKVLFDSRTTEVVLNSTPSDHLIKINPGCVGVYRVHYPSEMLERFIPAIKEKILPPLDRLNLQNDLFAMVQSGRESTSKLLKFLESFIDEDNYTVWESISSCMAALSVLLSNTEYDDAFKVYGRKLYSKIYEKVGWEEAENESHLTALLRSLVIGKLVSFEESNVIEEAKKRFESHVNGTSTIPADLRATVYRAVAANCDDETYETLFSLYRKSDLQEEKNRIAQSMGAAKDASRIKRVLQFSISDEVRTQDSVHVIICVALNKYGRDAAWQFFQDNYEELHSRYESGFLISALVKYCTQNFATEEKAKEVENFFAKHPVPAAARAIKQSLESIRLKADWLSRDLINIQSYLLSANEL
ncbi:Puromycin-sensitive aminopeptidase-like protein [Dinothrombium tinctorium]|uniref:Aminopeptidase n=1 Tax=Dinothrombium tinctorium TaxID=1965070 RepID=A0A3S3PZV8_9ACAR|nr:Puromycin-sensitive aminopeptidase-like protein [Dinothrombium tinctorium]RWS04097.1 Puromycin-sensitive aminopeptidase-like protein [Dinothrombium tinctorium]RWS11263.1 Puromycin-sensitive aminopeptidase-like protein [Dinothrombium tinctorium]